MKHLTNCAIIFISFQLMLCSVDDAEERFFNACALSETSDCINGTPPPDVNSLDSVASTAYDVIVVMGQSNTLAGLGYDSVLDKSSSRIFQLGRRSNDMNVIEAKEPLDNHESIPGHIGFALTFCKWYTSVLLDTGRNILIIPCGMGATGFGDQRWNKGNDLYEDAVARTNYVLNQFPGSDLKTILWHQGEDDIDTPGFQQALDSMIVNFRRDLQTPTNAPFILGGMVPYWSNQSEARRYSECVIKTTPMRIPGTAFVDPASPCRIVKVDNSVDEIHFNAEGQRELGYRYFNAYRSFH
jgi:hypothetical protein